MTVIHGAAHVAGTYHVSTPGTGSFIRDGVELIKDIGFGAVKLFLSANYSSSDYVLDSTFTGSPTSLTELVQEPPFAAVLNDATLQHFILNTFGLTNQGHNDPWRAGLIANPNLLEQEYNEIKELTEYLLTTYDGDGKTFVIKSWEGDWSLQGGTALDGTQYNDRHSRREDLMVAFFRARWQGIVDGHRAVPTSDCRVLHAVEANRVTEGLLNRNAPRMINRILPRMRGMLDLVSYSAYDSVFDLSPGGDVWSSSQAALLVDLQSRFTSSIQALQDTTGVRCMIGEWGIPENEVPVGYTLSNILDAVNAVLEAEDVAYNIYWQVFDNEGTPPANRGFWLYDDNGDLTLAGTAWTTYLT